MLGVRKSEILSAVLDIAELKTSNIILYCTTSLHRCFTNATIHHLRKPTGATILEYPDLYSIPEK